GNGHSHAIASPGLAGRAGLEPGGPGYRLQKGRAVQGGEGGLRRAAGLFRAAPGRTPELPGLCNEPGDRGREPGEPDAGPEAIRESATVVRQEYLTAGDSAPERR